MKSPVPPGTWLSLPSFLMSKQESITPVSQMGGIEAQKGALAEVHPVWKWYEPRLRCPDLQPSSCQSGGGARWEIWL